MNAAFPNRSLMTIILALSVLLFGFAGFYYRSLLAHVITYTHWRLQVAANFQEGYVNHQGTRLYYQSYGEGTPIVLLHGGLTSMKVFFTLLPKLAATHRVVMIDLRGQGGSTLGELPLTYRLMAADVLAVMTDLNLAPATVIGWSDGGNVGLLMSLLQPSKVKALVTMGSNYNPSGLSAELQQSLNEGNLAEEAPLSKLLYYLDSPHPSKWRELARRISEMWLTLPNLSEADLATIRTPALIVVGDNDKVRREHASIMAAEMQHAKMLVIPQTGHNLLFEAPDQLLEEIMAFLVANAV